MPYVTPSMTNAELQQALHRTLHVNQRELADLLGVSPRTVSRNVRSGMMLLPSTCERLARTCYPHDTRVAAELAARAGKTLVELGLDAPPVAVPPRAPTGLHRHVVDAIVSVAAEAMQSPPQAMRPAVLAAFERALALGMTTEEVIAALSPVKPKAK